MRSYWAKFLRKISQWHITIWFFFIPIANFPIQFNRQLISLLLNIIFIFGFIGWLKAFHLKILHKNLYPQKQENFLKRLENYYQKSGMNFYGSPTSFFSQTEMENLVQIAPSYLNFKNFIKYYKELD